MYIKSARIDKNAFLSLNGIRTVELDLPKGINVILGTNGTGKSTLMKELSVLPSMESNYLKGGSSVITVEHLGIDYRLICDFTGRKAVYWFYKGEENLNKSFSITEQRLLAEKEFGYKDYLHALLLGDVRLSSMLPNARKELLLKLCPMDMKYVQKVLDSIKVSHRDTKGVIKHLNSKLADTANMRDSVGYDESLVNRRDALVNEVTELNRYIIDPNTDSDALEEQITFLYECINANVERFKGFNQERCPFTDINDLNGLQARMGEIRGSLEILSKRKHDLINKIDQFTDTENERYREISSAEDIRKAIAESRGEASDLDVDLIPDTDYDLICKRLENFKQKMIFLKADDIKFFPNHYENLDSYVEKVLNELHDVEQALESKAYRLESLKSNLSHLNAHFEDDLIECPKCNHQFTSSKDDVKLKIASLEEERDTLIDKIREDENKKKELEEMTDKVKRFVLFRNEYRKICEESRIPDFILEAFPSEENVLKKIVRYGHSHNLNTCIDVHIEYCKKCIEKSEILSRIGYLDRILKIKEEFGDSHAVRLEKLNDEINKIEKESKRLSDILDRAVLFEDNYLNYSRIASDALDQLGKVESLIIDYMNAHIGKDANARKTKTMIEIKRLESIIGKYEAFQKDYEKCGEEREHMMDVNHIHEFLIDALSHQNGVIADTLGDFMTSITHHMNDVLSNIWIYPLTVSLSYNSKEEFDYKFLLDVNESIPMDKRKDISEGSRGQKEIIDFAFVIAIRRIHNLSKFPLQLDEVGSGFDEGHSTNFIEYCKYLLETGECEQSFIINQYSSVYGGLGDSNVIVLDKRNIVVPDGYNTRTIITRSGDEKEVSREKQTRL